MTPPGSTLFVLLFGAGLATGLLRFPAPWLSAMLLAILALALRREAQLLVFATMVGLGIGSIAQHRAGKECAARLRPGPVAIEVRTMESARRGRTRVLPLDIPCHESVVAILPPGLTPPPGTPLEVRGRWRASEQSGWRPGGVLVIRSAEPVSGSGTVPARLRTGMLLSARAESLFGGRAPMVEALVLGWRSDLDPELRDRFARSGLAHLLAISGLHVGILAGWVAALIRLAGRSPTAARQGAALAALGYAALLGWPPPATRAAALLALLSHAMTEQRRVRPTALLGACVLAVLAVDPRAVVSVGAWLSVAAVWGVVRATRAGERAGVRHPVTRLLAASIGATFATAPITAWAFGSVALGGVALNLVAIPLAAIAVPGVMAALLLVPFAPSLAASVAGGAGLSLWALERLAVFGSSLPALTVVQVPGPAAALPWVGVAGLLWWVTVPGLARPAVTDRALLAVTVLFLIGPVRWLVARLGPTRSGLTLYLLDVGQGDAAAIRTPGGAWILVDAGPEGREDRSASRFLAARSDGRLALLVASHPHADHIGGAMRVLDRVTVDAVADPAFPVADSGYLALLDRVAEEGSRWVPVRRGWYWERDGVRFTALHPDTAWAGWGEDANEDSVVLLIEYGRFRALFTGDAGRPVEALIAGQVGPVDLLKLGHHGSRTATGPEWLDELRPRLAVISVGSNRYGHPAPEVLERLRARAVPMWRTDRDGQLTVQTDGVRMTIRGRGRREVMNLEPGRGEPPVPLPQNGRR